MDCLDCGFCFCAAALLGLAAVMRSLPFPLAVTGATLFLSFLGSAAFARSRGLGEDAASTPAPKSWVEEIMAAFFDVSVFAFFAAAALTRSGGSSDAFRFAPVAFVPRRRGEVGLGFLGERRTVGCVGLEACGLGSSVYESVGDGGGRCARTSSSA